MEDLSKQRIYCAEQIFVPEDLPAILKRYAKEVIKRQPEDIIEFSAAHFEREVTQRDQPALSFSENDKPPQSFIRSETS